MAKKTSAVIRILRTARKLLAKKGGWIQGRYNNRRGGYCAAGAIESAAKRERAGTDLLEARQLVERSLRGYKTRRRNLISYNDSPRRSQDQVVALFDRALVRAQNATKGKR